MRILIADDQRLFADGLKVVIESRAPQFEVVGIASNGREAIRMVGETDPDIVLMDVRMPEMDGVEATRAIHATHPEVKVLIVTTFADDEYVKQSLRHGAVGYLLKNRPAEEIVNSIRALGSGILQIDPAVSANLLSYGETGSKGDNKFRYRLQTLSFRERQVLQLMVKAMRITAIADDLGIAPQTVRNHISNIYFKLHIHDRLEIINYIAPIRSYLKDSDV